MPPLYSATCCPVFHERRACAQRKCDSRPKQSRPAQNDHMFSKGGVRAYLAVVWFHPNVVLLSTICLK